MNPKSLVARAVLLAGHAADHELFHRGTMCFRAARAARDDGAAQWRLGEN